MFISLNVQKYSLNTGSNKKQTKSICQTEKHNLWGLRSKQEHSMLCHVTVHWQGSAPRTQQLSWLITATSCRRYRNKTQRHHEGHHSCF